MSGSSVASACVEVSLPFSEANDVQYNSSSDSELPASRQISVELGAGGPDSEDQVDLAQLNLMQQILQCPTASPRYSVLSDLDLGCDWHRPQSRGTLTAVDGEISDSDGGESGEAERNLELSGTSSDSKIDASSLKEKVEKLQDDEGKKREKDGTVLDKDIWSESKLSDAGTCTRCDVYTVSFQGLHTFSSSSFIEKEVNHESFDASKTELLDSHVESTNEKLSPSSQPQQEESKERELEEASVPAVEHDRGNKETASSTSYEVSVYTVSFGGLYTFPATPPSPRPKESNQDELDGGLRVEQKGEQIDNSNLSRNELLPSMEEEENAEHKLDSPVTRVEKNKDKLKESSPTFDLETDNEIASISYETYTVNFGGISVYTSSATSSLEETEKQEVDGGTEKQSQMDVEDSTTGIPSTSQDGENGEMIEEESHNSVEKQFTTDSDCQSGSEGASTTCNVYTVRFGGLLTFSSSSQTLEIDDRDDSEKVPRQADVSSEQSSDVPVCSTGEKLSPSIELAAGSGQREGGVADVEEMSPATTTSDTTRTPFEVFNVSFTSMHNFTSTPCMELTVSDEQSTVDSNLPSPTSTSNSMEQIDHSQSSSSTGGKPWPSKEQVGSDERDKVTDVEEQSPAETSDTTRAPFEVFNVSFSGVHTFTSTPSTELTDSSEYTTADSNTPFPISNSNSVEQIDHSQSSSSTRERLLPSKERTRSDEREVVADVEEECPVTTTSDTIRTPFEVFNVSFKSMHTFTSTPSMELTDSDEYTTADSNTPSPTSTLKSGEQIDHSQSYVEDQVKSQHAMEQESILRLEGSNNRTESPNPQRQGEKSRKQKEGALDVTVTQDAPPNNVSTHHQVYTMTFGGLYTFVSTPLPNLHERENSHLTDTPQQLLVQCQAH